MAKRQHYLYENMNKEEQMQEIQNFMKEKDSKIKQGIMGGIVFALETVGLFATPYVAIAMAISAIYASTKFSGAIVLNGFIKELSNLNYKEKSENVTLLSEKSKEDLEPNSSFVTVGHTHKSLEQIKKETENFNKMGAYEKSRVRAIRAEIDAEKKKEEKEDVSSKE